MRLDLTRLWSRYRWQTVFIAGTGIWVITGAVLTGQWRYVPPWVVASLALVGLEWVQARMATRIDRGTAAALWETIRALPPQTALLDRRTGTALRIIPRRTLKGRLWQVDRIPADATVQQEVDADFAAGRISTLAGQVFVVMPSRVGVLDSAVPVQRGADGIPTPHTPAGRTRHRHWRGFWLRLRTGVMLPTAAEITELVEQLRRAEPVNANPEEEQHADA